jgi:hypothetical protein
LLSYSKLSRKPLLFRSFTGLSVKEFNDIYNKEITKRYHDYELQCLSSQRKNRSRSIGADRPFKLDVKDRFLMLLVYHRLYITYTLAGFLFDLDQSNTCRDIQKIESSVRQCLPIPQKIYGITKRLKMPQDVEQYFPAGFLAFIDSIEQRIPRPLDKRKMKEYYSGKKKRHIVKNQFMANNLGFIIHKTGHRKGRRHDYNIYNNNHPTTPKQVIVNVFDLGYLGIEKDFPEQLSAALPYKKLRNQQWLSAKKKILQQGSF